MFAARVRCSADRHTAPTAGRGGSELGGPARRASRRDLETIISPPCRPRLRCRRVYVYRGRQRSLVVVSRRGGWSADQFDMQHTRSSVPREPASTPSRRVVLRRHRLHAATSTSCGVVSGSSERQQSLARPPTLPQGPRDRQTTSRPSRAPAGGAPQPGSGSSQRRCALDPNRGPPAYRPRSANLSDSKSVVAAEAHVSRRRIATTVQPRVEVTHRTHEVIIASRRCDPQVLAYGTRAQHNNLF